ncbi:hypothetical protein LP414_11675 [Polaromonas sp. P1(28)-13]|nr:hypothetical protein LP414_11675 [Polaromonas sp. P1(28)-13]
MKIVILHQRLNDTRANVPVTNQYQNAMFQRGISSQLRVWFRDERLARRVARLSSARATGNGQRATGNGQRATQHQRHSSHCYQFNSCLCPY